jgi:hypothetical protein
MARPYNRIAVLTLAAFFIIACSQVPMSTSPLATSMTSVLTSSPSTALPVIPTNVPSTMTSIPVQLTEISHERSNSMKIRITVEGTELSATLIDNKTTQDFISLLPLTLTLEDYGNTEKVSDLPKRLSTDGAPAGIDPSIGDITYYAPWGNLAIFINDFGYSSGLVLLGKFDGDMTDLNVSGPIGMTIELIE